MMAADRGWFALMLLVWLALSTPAWAQENAAGRNPAECGAAGAQRLGPPAPESVAVEPAAAEHATDTAQTAEQPCAQAPLGAFDALEWALTPAQAGEGQDGPDTADGDDAAARQAKEPAAVPGAATDAPANAQQPGTKPEETPANPAPQQTKRILGVMPNFRAVSAGTRPPPPTAKQSFILATQNSFDYSAFIFVGFTSAFAEWTDAHKELGEGMTGYGRYYWRGVADKTDGNYWVLFALPTLFHQDERYFTRGKGGFWKRLGYAASRVVITPNYQGHDSFNVSELAGRAIAQAISVSYYPSGAHSAEVIGSKYGYAIMRDALTNIFREFWPDISSHLHHRHR